MPVKLSSIDLKYSYSKFSVNGAVPAFRGKPDGFLFNKHEESEILPMIEKVMNDLHFVEGTDVHILEDMINTGLPSNARTRSEVYDWLLGELRGK